MYYIIDFSIISVAFLSITAFFYKRQPKVPSVRNTLFGILLFLGVFFAVFDILVVALEPVAYKMPSWLYYWLNVIYLLSVQLSAALFLSYCLVLTGRVKGAVIRTLALSLIPFFIIFLLMALPLGPSGIFYLDESNIYHRGALYAALYIDSALYLAASLVAVLSHRGQLRPQKLLCICTFLAMLFLSMIIQYTHPKLLLNAMANAFALTLIYHVLEAPSTHIDALTGVLNRLAIPLIVLDSYEQVRRCTMLVFTITSLRLVNHSLGMKVGDRLLVEFASYLRSSFGAGHIFRVSGEAFAVLLTGGEYCSRAQLQAYHEAIPESFSAGQIEAPLAVSLAGINSEDAPTGSDLLSLGEHILQLHRKRRLGPVLLVDAAFKNELHRAETLERRLEEAVSSGNIEVFYQPIHNCNGVLTALEALVRIPDGGGGYLPTQEAVELSEKNGSIHRLGELILRRVCCFLRDQDGGSWGLHHIGVNLSALQFMRDDLWESVSGIMDEYGVAPGLLSFEITETASASVADITKNMRRINEAGCSFLLDDFGKGYANFNNIAQLPLLCVKIDKALLWEAMESEEKLAFLRGVVDMLHTMELTSVCEGVETQAQARLLQELGVDMLQGYLFARPLPPGDLLAYMERMAADGV